LLCPPSERGVIGGHTVFTHVCVCVSVRTQIPRKRFEIEAWYQLPTNRKWPVADGMMTSLMTSRDRERSKS